MKRIASFDLIRALAIFGIVLSHLFLTGEGSFVHAMGKWLGATFTAVFLGLSALILGSSWIGKGRPVYGGRFFFHRVSRLAVPYWLFLTAFLLVVLCLQLSGHTKHGDHGRDRKVRRCLQRVGAQ